MSFFFVVPLVVKAGEFISVKSPPFAVNDPSARLSIWLRLTGRDCHHMGMDAGLLVTLIIFSTIPLILLAERLVPKRREWLLNWRELAEDAFWVLAGFLIWFPLYDKSYDTRLQRIAFLIRAKFDSWAFTCRINRTDSL
jgi:hypothetical protein